MLIYPCGDVTNKRPVKTVAFRIRKNVRDAKRLVRMRRRHKKDGAKKTGK